MLRRIRRKNNLTLVKKNLEIKYQKIKQLEAIEQAQIEKKQNIEDINRLKTYKNRKWFIHVNKYRNPSHFNGRHCY